MTIDIASLVSDNLDIWTTAVERKSGTGRGGGKRLSLYGIDRLRALILDLALRGNLVPQDANDEPAQKLFGRICLSNPRELPSPRFEIPTTWCWVKFGQIAKFKPGRTPSRNDSRYWGGPYPWVSIADMDDGTTLADTSETVSDLASDDIFKGSLSPAGSILMSFKLTIGKIARLAMPAFHNEAIITVLPSIPELDPFLFQFLPICARTGVSRNAIKGATLNSASIFDIAIPLPPLGEQRRIVAKVDELMALCDALETESAAAMAAHQTLVEALLATLTASTDAADLATNWSRLETHFDTLFTTEASVDALKQVILDLAVRGKLVPQNPDDEPASELLKQLMRSKQELVRAGRAKRDKPLPKVKPDEAPFPLPQNWTWGRFPELGIFERGKSKHRPRNDPKLFQPGIYPLVQTGEVARADGVIEEFHSQYSDVGLAQSKMWPKGTLCITIAANIADVATLGFDACFPDSVVGFIPCKPMESPQYILYFMKTAKADLLKFAPSTAQKNINLGILETVLIPLPPLQEMARIVTKVDELMALCDALKTRITDAATTQKHLANAIVEQAAA